jgi:hypothetical protein
LNLQRMVRILSLIQGTAYTNYLNYERRIQRVVLEALQVV